MTGKTVDWLVNSKADWAEFLKALDQLADQARRIEQFEQGN